MLKFYIFKCRFGLHEWLYWIEDVADAWQYESAVPESRRRCLICKKEQRLVQIVDPYWTNTESTYE